MKRNLLLIFFALMACIGMTNMASASELAVVSVYPSSINVPAPGNTFQVNITIANVVNETGVHGGVFGWDLSLSWNGSVLSVAKDEFGDWMVVEGPFLKSLVPPGKTLFLFSPPTPYCIADISCAFLQKKEAFGSGTLVSITFNATAVGNTEIRIGNLTLEDYPGNNIPCTVVNGTVAVIPEFPASMTIPLFLIATTITAVMAKIAWSRRRREHIDFF